MSVTISPIASVAAVRDAPTKITEILKAHNGKAGSIADEPGLTTARTEADQLAARAAVEAERADLKQQTLADLRRLENQTELALADARSRLETAILPVMSTDPHVERQFELRQAKALARFIPLLDRARTEAAVDETVRRFADDAARQADWATLGVLRTATGPYLGRRGIDPATSEALRIVERTVVALRPRAAEPLAERHALEHGASRVAAAFARARDAIEGDERDVQIASYEADPSDHAGLAVAE